MLRKSLFMSCSAGVEGSKKAPLLIIMGVRGTILERQRFTMPETVRRPDFTVGVNKVWMRPHFFEMLDSLVSAGGGEDHVRFALWSSQTARNALSLTEGIQREPGMKGRNFVFSWSREQTSPDNFRRTTAVQTEDEWATLKDLNTVFRLLPEYNAKRTILIDDTASKARSMCDNFLWVPPFGEGEQMRDDDSLLRASQFIKDKLLNADDVRPFLPHRIFPGEVYTMDRNTDAQNANAADANSASTELKEA